MVMFYNHQVNDGDRNAVNVRFSEVVSSSASTDTGK